MATAKYKFGDLHTVPYTASGADVAKDTIVILGTVNGLKSSIGVAMKTIEDGNTEEGAIAVSGVFEFPKVSAAVIVAGEGCNWDASAGEVDDNAATAAVGDVEDFGKAMQAGANGGTTILIDIGPQGAYKAA